MVEQVSVYISNQEQPVSSTLIEIVEYVSVYVGEVLSGTGGGTRPNNLFYTCNGTENGLISVPGISLAVFSEVQQGPRWLKQYTGIDEVPENYYKINIDNTIKLGTLPGVQEEIYIRWEI